MATFERDGQTREASTPSQAVMLAFTGWREVVDPAPPAEGAAVNLNAAESSQREGTLPSGTTDAS